VEPDGAPFLLRNSLTIQPLASFTPNSLAPSFRGRWWCEGAACWPPSTSMINFFSMHIKSKINGPTGCWRPNFHPDNSRFLRQRHNHFSASVGFFRNSFACFFNCQPLTLPSPLPRGEDFIGRPLVPTLFYEILYRRHGRGVLRKQKPITSLIIPD